MRRRKSRRSRNKGHRQSPETDVAMDNGTGSSSSDEVRTPTNRPPPMTDVEISAVRRGLESLHLSETSFVYEDSEPSIIDESVLYPDHLQTIPEVDELNISEVRCTPPAVVTRSKIQPKLLFDRTIDLCEDSVIILDESCVDSSPEQTKSQFRPVENTPKNEAVVCLVTRNNDLKTKDVNFETKQDGGTVSEVTKERQVTEKQAEEKLTSPMKSKYVMDVTVFVDDDSETANSSKDDSNDSNISSYHDSNDIDSSVDDSKDSSKTGECNDLSSSTVRSEEEIHDDVEIKGESLRSVEYHGMKEDMNNGNNVKEQSELRKEQINVETDSIGNYSLQDSFKSFEDTSVDKKDKSPEKAFVACDSTNEIEDEVVDLFAHSSESKEMNEEIIVGDETKPSVNKEEPIHSAEYVVNNELEKNTIEDNEEYVEFKDMNQGTCDSGSLDVSIEPKGEESKKDDSLNQKTTKENTVLFKEYDESDDKDISYNQTQREQIDSVDDSLKSIDIIQDGIDTSVVGDSVEYKIMNQDTSDKLKVIASDDKESCKNEPQKEEIYLKYVDVNNAMESVECRNKSEQSGVIVSDSSEESNGSVYKQTGKEQIHSLEDINENKTEENSKLSEDKKLYKNEVEVSVKDIGTDEVEIVEKIFEKIVEKILKSVECLDLNKDIIYSEDKRKDEEPSKNQVENELIRCDKVEDNVKLVKSQDMNATEKNEEDIQQKDKETSKSRVENELSHSDEVEISVVEDTEKLAEPQYMNNDTTEKNGLTVSEEGTERENEELSKNQAENNFVGDYVHIVASQEMKKDITEKNIVSKEDIQEVSKNQAENVLNHSDEAENNIVEENVKLVTSQDMNKGTTEKKEDIQTKYKKSSMSQVENEQNSSDEVENSVKSSVKSKGIQPSEEGDESLNQELTQPMKSVHTAEMENVEVKDSVNSVNYQDMNQDKNEISPSEQPEISNKPENRILSNSQDVIYKNEESTTLQSEFNSISDDTESSTDELRNSKVEDSLKSVDSNQELNQNETEVIATLLSGKGEEMPKDQGSKEETPVKSSDADGVDYLKPKDINQDTIEVSATETCTNNKLPESQPLRNIAVDCSEIKAIDETSQSVSCANKNQNTEGSGKIFELSENQTVKERIHSIDESLECRDMNQDSTKGSNEFEDKEVTENQTRKEGIPSVDDSLKSVKCREEISAKVTFGDKDKFVSENQTLNKQNHFVDGSLKSLDMNQDTIIEKTVPSEDNEVSKEQIRTNQETIEEEMIYAKVTLKESNESEEKDVSEKQTINDSLKSCPDMNLVTTEKKTVPSEDNEVSENQTLNEEIVKNQDTTEDEINAKVTLEESNESEDNKVSGNLTVNEQIHSSKSLECPEKIVSSEDNEVSENHTGKKQIRMTQDTIEVKEISTKERLEESNGSEKNKVSENLTINEPIHFVDDSSKSLECPEKIVSSEDNEVSEKQIEKEQMRMTQDKIEVEEISAKERLEESIGSKDEDVSKNQTKKEQILSVDDSLKLKACQDTTQDTDKEKEIPLEETNDPKDKVPKSQALKEKKHSTDDSVKLEECRDANQDTSKEKILLLKETNESKDGEVCKNRTEKEEIHSFKSSSCRDETQETTKAEEVTLEESSAPKDKSSLDQAPKEQDNSTDDSLKVKSDSSKEKIFPFKETNEVSENQTSEKQFEESNVSEDVVVSDNQTPKEQIISVCDFLKSVGCQDSSQVSTQERGVNATVPIEEGNDSEDKEFFVNEALSHSGNDSLKYEDKREIEEVSEAECSKGSIGPNVSEIQEKSMDRSWEAKRKIDATHSPYHREQIISKKLKVGTPRSIKNFEPEDLGATSSSKTSESLKLEINLGGILTPPSVHEGFSQEKNSFEEDSSVSQLSSLSKSADMSEEDVEANLLKEVRRASFVFHNAPTATLRNEDFDFFGEIDRMEVDDAKRSSFYIKFDPIWGDVEMRDAPYPQNVAADDKTSSNSPTELLEVNQNVTLISPLKESEEERRLAFEIRIMKDRIENDKKIERGRQTEFQKKMAEVEDECEVAKKKLIEALQREDALKSIVLAEEKKEKILKMKVQLKQDELEKALVQKTHSEKSKNTVADRLKSETEEILQKLTSSENAFTVLHTKYENLKSLLMDLRSNEEKLETVISEAKDKIGDYDALIREVDAKHSVKMRNIQEELAEMEKQHCEKMARVRAQMRKAELKAETIESELQLQIKTNSELTSICDELSSTKSSDTKN